MARGIYADDSSDGFSRGRPGDFGDWLKLLPDAIDAFQARTGEPLVVELPADPPAHTRRLLETLGVEWEVRTVSEQSAQALTESVDCKEYGCTNQAVGRFGRYAGLCVEHIVAKKRSEAQDGKAGTATGAATSPPTQPTPLSSARSAEGFEAQVKELAALGRAADRARERARKATEAALVVKREADAAERRFRDAAQRLTGDRA